jgi:hypothetical protein
MVAFPGRFGVGIPVVFAVSILSGSFVASVWNLSGGIALLLVLQTAGLLSLYLPAWRRRRHDSSSVETSKRPS